MRLNKLRWLSAVLIFALISGIIVHLVLSTNEKPNTSESANYLASENTGVLSSETVITTLELDKVELKNQQLTALTMKLAELQSHVLRLNALGSRLADNANIPEKEFDFQHLPPSGGPSGTHSALSGKSFTELLVEITELESSLNHKENQLNMLESLTLGHHIEGTRYLSGRPIVKGWLSSYFGTRKDPFNGRPTMHKGIDFAGKEDGGIIATGSGVVTWADNRYGYGLLIEINHGGGLKTRYGHNKRLLVNVGDVVEKGQIIARMGSTGRSTGPHVHYEILRNDRQIDPIKFVYRKAK
jgi:murein DD-endopeptidase MepM/ murein hydrolase activator NlpD